MDIEKLIEQLRTDSLYADKASLEIMDLCMAAATALSTLQAENEKLQTLSKLGNMRAQDYRIMRDRAVKAENENEKLRAELEQVKRALAMMWFSYVNSDKEMPHSYETEALDEAERILGPWAECMPKYLRRGPKED